jgi:nucleotide-binding universal stress UspA family protein
MNDIRKIVVGIDGSESSINALTWALQEAKRHSADVHVVHVWSLPLALDPMGGAIYSPFEEFRSAAQGVVTHALEKVKIFVGDTKVTSAVEYGSASQHLLDAANTADMVVVGRRGHGGFLGLLIGSVAEQIAHHAKCPAVIVPL